MEWVIVGGKPKGKGRPRFYNGHAVTPKDTKEYEQLIAWSYRLQDGKLHAGEVSVTVKAEFRIPKSWSRKKRSEVIDTGKRPTVKPDIDNICKAVLDALNGIAYTDDTQVVRLIAEKAYNENNERVLIRVQDVEKDANAIRKLCDWLQKIFTGDSEKTTAEVQENEKKARTIESVKK